METIRYSPLGKQDMALGTEPFRVQLADGRYAILDPLSLYTAPELLPHLPAFPTTAARNALATVAGGRRGLIRAMGSGISYPVGGEWLNPEEWGVKADGNTDDTEAWQDIIDNADPGCMIRLPQGSGSDPRLSVVSGTLTYETRANVPGVSFFGHNPMCFAFDNRVASGGLFKFNNQASRLMQYYAVLEGFGITTTTTPATSHGIILAGVFHAYFHRLWIQLLSGDAIRVAMTEVENDSVSHLDIDNCRMQGCAGYGFNDASVAAVNQNSHTTIRNSFIFQNETGGCRWSGQILQFHGNTCDVNGGADGGLYIRTNSTAPQLVSVRANEFDSNGTVNLKVDGVQCLEVAGNKFNSSAGTLAGTFGPSTSIILGDGSSTFDAAEFFLNRISSNPTAPVAAFTGYDINANANNVNIRSTNWGVSQSGGTVTYYDDAGVNTSIVDEGCGSMDSEVVVTANAAATPYTPAMIPTKDTGAARTQGAIHRIRFDSTGAKTINAPTPTPAATAGRHLTLEIINNSGGAITVSFNATYKHANYTDPAAGMRRFCRYVWDSGNWIGAWSDDFS